jgi:RNA polymerase sigma-70 factor (ECF subfamily)
VDVRDLNDANADTDARLVRRLAKDIEGTFEDLVRAHQDRLYSGIRRLVGDLELAADLSQDTFIRAYKALCSYSPSRIRQLKLRGWLWSIALNVVRSNARHQGRRPRQSQVSVEELVDASNQPETSAINAANEIWWRDELKQLPVHRRNAVVLRFVGELSYAEIAAATKRPIGSVKSDVHRGLAVLAIQLKGKIQS